MDSDGNIEAGSSEVKLNIKPGLLRAGARDGVADVAALRGRLGETLGRKVGPAEFALRMVRMPEEQAIKWG